MFNTRIIISNRQRIKFDGHTGTPKFGSMFVYISPQKFHGMRYFSKETINGWKKNV